MVTIVDESKEVDVPDWVVDINSFRHWTEAGQGKVTGAPDEPEQRERDGDAKAGQYPDGKHAKQGHQAQPELA